MGTRPPNKGSFQKGHSGYWLGKKRKTPWMVNLKGRPRKPHSLKTKIKMSNAHKGERCHWWKGGLTKKSAVVRNSFEYKLWRKAVYERDKYTCRWCKTKGIRLHAHHIKPFSQFPELRFAIDNGITLCKDCHKTTYSYLNNEI